MKKCVFLFLLVLTTNELIAQYSQKWNSTAGTYFVGCENMDGDASKEVIYLFKTTMNYDEGKFYIIDGQTGSLEFSMNCAYVLLGYSSSTSYGSVFIDPSFPKLVDVDDDGKYELLFYGKIDKSETSNTVHCIAYSSTTKSGETSINKKVNIKNYPNPFNDETTIKYNVPENNLVTIKLFDINGNELKILLNEHKEIGEYNLTFKSEDLNSGTYFYQVQIGNYFGSKKMLVIK